MDETDMDKWNEVYVVADDADANPQVSIGNVGRYKIQSNIRNSNVKIYK